MNELGSTIKNQFLWYLFSHIRLKLDHLVNNSIFMQELIHLFYVESANQNPLQSIKSLLLFSLQYSILLLKTLEWSSFLFSHTPCPSVFLKMKWIICCHLITACFIFDFNKTCITTCTTYILPTDLNSF